jgi:hypothetical protein
MTDPDRWQSMPEKYVGDSYLGQPQENPPLVPDNDRLKIFVTAFSPGGSAFNAECTNEFLDWIISDVNIGIKRSFKVSFQM